MQIVRGWWRRRKCVFDRWFDPGQETCTLAPSMHILWTLICRHGTMRLSRRRPVFLERPLARRVHTSLRHFHASRRYVHATFDAVKAILVQPDHVIDVETLFPLLRLRPMRIDVDKFAVRAVACGLAAPICRVHAVRIRKARMARQSRPRRLPSLVFHKPGPDRTDRLRRIPAIPRARRIPTRHSVFQASQSFSQRFWAPQLF